MRNSPNQQVLAQLRAEYAIARAKLGPQPDPGQLMAEALREAVEAQAEVVAELACSGLVGSAQYELAAARLRTWTLALKLNR